MLKEELFEKVYGCLIGAAYGDALGAPTENRTREQIFEKWGYVDELMDAPDDVYARGNLAGQVTDDFSMAYETIKEIIRSNGCINTDVSDRALLEWGKDERFVIQFAGPTSRRYIDKLKGLVSEEKETFKPANDNSKASNGGAMKIGPVSCFAKGDIDKAIKITKVVCGGTHGNRISLSAAYSVSAAVNAALCGKNFFEIISLAVKGAEIGEDMGDDIAGPSMTKRLRFAIKIGFSSKTLDEAMEILRSYFDCSGMAADSVPVSFGLIAASGGNVCEAVKAAVNIGNDTDTMATIVGAVLGAYCGDKAFPEKIKKKIDYANNYDLSALASKIIDIDADIQV